MSLSELSGKEVLANLNHEVHELLFETQLSELTHEEKENLFRRLMNELYDGKIPDMSPDYMIIQADEIGQVHDRLEPIWEKIDEYLYEHTLMYIQGDDEREGREEGDDGKKIGNFDVYRPSRAYLYSLDNKDVGSSSSPLTEHNLGRKVYRAITELKGEDIWKSSLLISLDNHTCEIKDDDPSILDIILEVMEDAGMRDDGLFFSDDDPELVESYNFQIPVDDEWKIVRYQRWKQQVD